MKKQKYLLLEGRVPSKIWLYNKLLEIVNPFSYLRYSLSFTHDADIPNKITNFRNTLRHIHMYRQTKQIPLKHLHKTEKQSEAYNNIEINQTRCKVSLKTHMAISTFWSRHTVTGQSLQFSRHQTELLRMGSWTGHFSHIIQSYLGGGCNYAAGLKHISLILNGAVIDICITNLKLYRKYGRSKHLYIGLLPLYI